MEYYERYESRTAPMSIGAMIFGGFLIVVLLWMLDRFPQLLRGTLVIAAVGLGLAVILNWTAVDHFIAGAF